MGKALTPRQADCVERLRAFDAIASVGADAFGHRGHWRERVGRPSDARLILEIGCADAAFLTRIAAKHPSTAFVGLDWKYGDILHAAERVAASAVKNVSLIRGRAQDLVRFFAEGELDEIWVFHPDPCADASDRPNRLISEPFLLDAARVLRAGSPLTLKTDHAGYYQSTLALLGLPEPDWAINSPRARRRDLTPASELPSPSEAVRAVWSASYRSYDFWNDVATQSHAASRPFAEERTDYEDRFFAKHRPIFYIELIDVRARCR